MADSENATYEVTSGDNKTTVKAYSHEVVATDEWARTLRFKNAQGVVVAEFRYWDSYIVKD